MKRLRTFLAATFVLGVLGSGTELWLIDHTEDRWQWVPLILMAIGILTLTLHLAIKRTWSRRTFGAVMLGFIGGGFWGLWLHYQGNVEFEREVFPSLRGFELFWEAIRGATPALAPGTMVLLGLIGIAFVYSDHVIGSPERKTLT